MIPPFPDVNDFSSTTHNVNDWLSELTPLQMDPEKEREYYSSWFQFWFNTEHDGGNGGIFFQSLKLKVEDIG